MGNPFDFNQDGDWSTPERAYTHYGVDPLMRGEKNDVRSRAGCGCVGALLGALLVAVFWLLFM